MEIFEKNHPRYNCDFPIAFLASKGIEQYVCIEADFAYRDACKAWATIHGGRWAPRERLWICPISLKDIEAGKSPAVITSLFDPATGLCRSDGLNVKGDSTLFERALNLYLVARAAGAPVVALEDDDEGDDNDELPASAKTVLQIKTKGDFILFKVIASGDAFRYWKSEMNEIGAKFDWDTKWWKVPHSLQVYSFLKRSLESRIKRGETERFEMSPKAQKLFEEARPYFSCPRFNALSESEVKQFWQSGKF